MFASSGREMQLLADGLLSDLCFLDDRDADYEHAREELLHRYGKLGVAGPFEAMFDSEQCQAEVASLYAEVFCRLGYLVVDHQVSSGQWRELAAGLRNMFEDQDLRLSEAEAKLGPASLVVNHRVLCYASSVPGDGWLFVDCCAERARFYEPGQGSYRVVTDSDPLLRSVRLSAGASKPG